MNTQRSIVTDLDLDMAIKREIRTAALLQKAEEDFNRAMELLHNTKADSMEDARNIGAAQTRIRNLFATLRVLGERLDLANEIEEAMRQTNATDS